MWIGNSVSRRSRAQTSARDLAAVRVHASLTAVAANRALGLRLCALVGAVSKEDDYAWRQITVNMKLENDFMFIHVNTLVHPTPLSAVQ